LTAATGGSSARQMMLVALNGEIEASTEVELPSPASVTVIPTSAEAAAKPQIVAEAGACCSTMCEPKLEANCTAADGHASSTTTIRSCQYLADKRQFK
jgi:hypothetical protein